MDHANPARVAVEEDTLASSITRNDERLPVPSGVLLYEQFSGYVVSPYSPGAYDFDDGGFGRNAPTLAAGAGMLTPVPRVNIETKR
jgi:hypothetical protein